MNNDGMIEEHPGALKADEDYSEVTEDSQAYKAAGKENIESERTQEDQPFYDNIETVSEKDKPSTSGTILPPIHNQNMP
jgi:hypothetical protein